MADSVPEKALGTGSEDSGSQCEIFECPSGLKGIYYHPYFQVVILGFVCFMCPGMFNALGGIGGGGQVNTTAQSNAATATYAIFAFCAFFSGFNVQQRTGTSTDLVPRDTWILPVYCFLTHMTAYATEVQKGLFICIFWAIFNLGAVIGSAVAFATNFNNKTNTVGSGTYIGFLVLTLIGVSLALLMADPKKIVRTDGTKVTLPRHPSWKAEFYSLYVALKTDPMIILLFPMFVASNYFYTWQQNDYNAAIFNIRTRSLNAFIYWAAQIFGSLFLGYCVLDLSQFGRRTRAFAGWIIVTVMVFATHAWAYEYQKNYTRASIAALTARMDFSDSAYAAYAWLYIFCGLLDAMWQTFVYWLLGAMSNDLAKLAVFAGFYKSLQSAGAAGVWHADAVASPYLSIFISTWVLCVAGVVCALPMIHYRIKDHTDVYDVEFESNAHGA